MIETVTISGLEEKQGKNGPYKRFNGGSFFGANDPMYAQLVEGATVQLKRVQKGQYTNWENPNGANANPQPQLEAQTAPKEKYSEADKKVFEAKDIVGMMQTATNAAARIVQGMAAGGLVKDSKEAMKLYKEIRKETNTELTKVRGEVLLEDDSF